jgi:hypothetical protein
VFTLLTLGQDVPEAVRQRAQAAIGLIDTQTAAGLAAIVAAQQVNPVPPVLQGQLAADAAPAQTPAEASAP